MHNRPRTSLPVRPLDAILTQSVSESNMPRSEEWIEQVMLQFRLRRAQASNPAVAIPRRARHDGSGTAAVAAADAPMLWP